MTIALWLYVHKLCIGAHIHCQESVLLNSNLTNADTLVLSQTYSFGGLPDII